MFKTMIKKVQGKKGFTLMEMLIVVAIIAILVAVAFPVFNSQLDKARNATDSANVRSAKAVAMAKYLTDGTAVAGFFDAAAGTISAANIKPGYGQSAADVAEDGAGGAPKGNVIKVDVTDVGVFTATWVAPAA